jgi:hypothetical protein
MTLDRELVKEACAQFWKDHHETVESMGYTLGKESFLLSSDGISLVATIDPAYSQRMWKRFRNILPKEYNYKNEKITVIIFPSF